MLDEIKEINAVVHAGLNHPTVSDGSREREKEHPIPNISLPSPAAPICNCEDPHRGLYV